MTANKHRKREARDIAARTGLSYCGALELCRALGYEQVSALVDDGKAVSEIRAMARAAAKAEEPAR